MVVETKWTNSGHCTPEGIFGDFLRLAAVKRVDPDAKCIFLLAGHASSFNLCVRGMPFNCGAASNTGIGKSGQRKRVSPTPSNTRHREGWGDTIRSLLVDGLTIPDSFVSQACAAHPIQSDLGTVDFQAQAWEIKEVSASSLRASDWH